LQVGVVGRLEQIFAAGLWTAQPEAGFSEPQSKPEYETVVASGKPHVRSEFAADLVVQKHTGMQILET
jgi:hypothetical protein